MPVFYVFLFQRLDEELNVMFSVKQNINFNVQLIKQNGSFIVWFCRAGKISVAFILASFMAYRRLWIVSLAKTLSCKKWQKILNNSEVVFTGWIFERLRFLFQILIFLIQNILEKKINQIIFYIQDYTFCSITPENIS